MFEDTAPSVLALYHERLRAMSTQQKAKILAGMMADGKRLAMIGVRMRHPDANDEEVRVRTFVRMHGREVARRFFSSIPDDAR